jgi:tetratricopeptide (TPR) repeat protein
LNHKPGIALCAGNMGSIYFREGDLEKARTYYEKSLALNRELRYRPGVASHLENVGNVMVAEGELAGGMRLLQQAVSTADAAENKVFRAIVLVSYAEAKGMEGDFDAAGRACDEAIELNGGVGSRILDSSNQLRIAAIQLEAGKYAEAEENARNVMQQFESRGDMDHVLATREILARSLLEQGKVEAAQGEIRKTVPLAKRTQDRRLRLKILITAARIRARAHPVELPAARATLRDTVTEASRDGYFVLYLESKLRLAELGVAAGETAAAERDLEALVRESSSKGYLLFVKKAKELRAKAEALETAQTKNCRDQPGAHI